MGDPLRFRVQMVGFGRAADGGIAIEIEWLTSSPLSRRFPITREQFDTFGPALLDAVQSQAVYGLVLDGPDAAPLLALLQAVRDGQTATPDGP